MEVSNLGNGSDLMTRLQPVSGLNEATLGVVYTSQKEHLRGVDYLQETICTWTSRCDFFRYGSLMIVLMLGKSHFKLAGSRLAS